MSDYSALQTDETPDAAEQTEILVEEFAGLRILSFDGDRLQSAMKVSRPHELAVAYTQRIMSFLLFHPAPERIAMIGLGGGSLAKFIYREMPETSTTIVEVDPRVLATARSHFYLPQNDDRLTVVIAEGSEYVAAHPGSVDVLIVDGFDFNGQAPSLSTPSFYDDCFAALRPGGILVVNLFDFGESVDVFVERIRASFGGRVLTSTSDLDDNCVVFGFQDACTYLSDSKLIDRAETLKQKYRLAFPRFVQTMQWIL